jgi:hypothetical protein
VISSVHEREQKQKEKALVTAAEVLMREDDIPLPCRGSHYDQLIVPGKQLEGVVGKGALLCTVGGLGCSSCLCQGKQHHRSAGRKE